MYRRCVRRAEAALFFFLVKSVSFASRPLEPTPASSTRRDATAAHAPRGGAPRVVRRRDARARFLSRVSRPRPGLRARRGGAALFPSRGTCRFADDSGDSDPTRDGAYKAPPADTRAPTRGRRARRPVRRGRARECVSADLESVVVASVTETERSGRCARASGRGRGGPVRGADEGVRVRLRPSSWRAARAGRSGLARADSGDSARGRPSADAVSDDTRHRANELDDDEEEAIAALCGAPFCEAESVCAENDADADAAKGACVAPVCGALCASCVSSLGLDQKTRPRSTRFAARAGTSTPASARSASRRTCSRASEGARGDASPEGRFGFNPYAYGGLSYSQSLYAPGYGGYGPNNPYRPGGVPGNTPHGPYPGSYYPGYAVYSPPWFVSVYSKSKALVVSSLCYWWPWYPACRPPPPRPIKPPPRPFPKPADDGAASPSDPGGAAHSRAHHVRRPVAGGLDMQRHSVRGRVHVHGDRAAVLLRRELFRFRRLLRGPRGVLRRPRRGAQGYSAGIDSDLRDAALTSGSRGKGPALTRDDFKAFLEAGAQRKSGARRRRENGTSAVAERVPVPVPVPVLDPIRARVAAASTTAPFAATETRREAPVFDIWGADVDVVLDVGAEGDVTKLARSSFREYFARGGAAAGDGTRDFRRRDSMRREDDTTRC